MFAYPTHFGFMAFNIQYQTVGYLLPVTTGSIKKIIVNKPPDRIQKSFLILEISMQSFALIYSMNIQISIAQ